MYPERTEGGEEKEGRRWNPDMKKGRETRNWKNDSG